MEQKTIQLQGITRRNDNQITTDGETIELINARIKDGTIQPIAPPHIDTTYGISYEQIYIHANAGYTNRLCVPTGAQSLTAYIGTSTTPVTIIPECPPITNIQVMGNMVTVLTEQSTLYLIFKDNAYTYLGERPPLPVIRFYAYDYKAEDYEETLSTKFIVGERLGYTKTHETGLIEYDTVKSKYAIANWQDVTTAVVGTYSKGISQINDNNRFAHAQLIRYALRLYDGTHLIVSPPVLIYPFSGRRSIKINSTTLGVENLSATLTISSYQLKCYIHSIKSENEKWSDIIQSVDIFLSSPISNMKSSEIKYTLYDYTTQWTQILLNDYNEKEYTQAIADIATFYKIKSFPYTELPEEFSFTDKNYLDNLEQNEQLSDNTPTMHSQYADHAYTYNSRLHLAGIRNRMYSGYPFDCFQCAKTSFTQVRGHVEVHIKHTLGAAIVYRAFNWTNLDLNPYISYPDSRAFKIIIYAEKRNYCPYKQSGNHCKLRDETPEWLEGKVCQYEQWTEEEKGICTLDTDLRYNYRKEYELTPSPVMNIAYAIPQLNNLSEANFTPVAAIPIPQTANDTEYSPNTLKVSETQNPFYFPAKQTYTPSSAPIIALCSNTAAISQGQFGQFPLYIFCQDGIYAMNVGTDGIAYISTSPVSRYVCNNPRSVTPIDNAVIFTTEAGIMLISGAQVQNLSEQINGYASPIVEATITDKNGQQINYIQKALDIAGLNLSQYLSRPSGTTPEAHFRDYLKNSDIGYNHQERELIIANPDYPYSYLYNLNSGQYTKITQRITAFINTYPQCLAIRHTGSITEILDMQNNAIAIVNTAIVTQPLKFGTTAQKKLTDTALRCLLRVPTHQLLLRGQNLLLRGNPLSIVTTGGCYILGSNDAIHFTVIAQRGINGDTRDILLRPHAQSYTYYILVFVSGLRTDAQINFAETIINTRFNNKLR